MTHNPRKRCDHLLLDAGLAATLAEAQALVMAGKVIADDQRVDLASQMLPVAAVLRVKSKRFVSRGGDKLQSAFEGFGLTEMVSGCTVLDVGCSTGGFTDCCLKLGAKKVYAIDVGTNVVDWSLRQDRRVDVRENCDIRNLSASDIEPVDLIVADVSFNSLQVLLPPIMSFARRGLTKFVLLVKPQFELPREMVPDGGVVVDDKARQLALQLVRDELKTFDVAEFKSIDSTVPGRRGNVEIFVYFTT